MKPAAIFLIGLGIIVLIVVMVSVTNNRLPSINSFPTPTVNTMSQNSLTKEEENQILSASKEMVMANTEKGYKYSLSIKKHVGDYTRVDVTPAEGEMLDPAQVILEKKNGVWTAITFGTSFPDLYEKVPELFR